jgi:HK97 family phage portal protein
LRIFGLEISRPKTATKSQNLSAVDSSRGWWPVIRESFTGAWQRNITVTATTALANPTLFRCISLISSDIAKMRCRLVSKDDDGIWTEAESASFSPVLRKPNRYQNRIQFYTSWVQSKLTHGNTYVLKARDNRGVVVALYVLDPMRVKPMVAPDGSVWYQLDGDDLSNIPNGKPAVPARDIIHDRWNTYYHPLCGLSPIYACGLAAVEGLEIQRSSTRFFQNGSKPGGVLTHPEFINDEIAKEYKERWEANYGGDNQGRVAVLGNGLTYQPIGHNSTDSQLIEQLKWTGETICGAFGVPAYMAGVGQAPLNNNVQSLAELYYAQCLQPHIESLELCLDEGLELPAPYGTEFDLDDLLRMDTATQVKTLSEGVLGGLFKPNEGRKKLGLKPTAGGDQVFLQQQNFSLPALAKRDAQDDPFGTAKAEPAPAPTANDNTAAEEAQAAAKAALAEAQAAREEAAAARLRLERAKALRSIEKGLAHA